MKLGFMQSSAKRLRGKGYICYICYNWEIQGLTSKKCSINADWLTWWNIFPLPIGAHVLSQSCPQKEWPLSTGGPWGWFPVVGWICFHKENRESSWETELWWLMTLDDLYKCKSVHQQAHCWRVRRKPNSSRLSTTRSLPRRKENICPHPRKCAQQHYSQSSKGGSNPMSINRWMDK